MELELLAAAVVDRYQITHNRRAHLVQLFLTRVSLLSLSEVAQDGQKQKNMFNTLFGDTMANG